MACYDFRQRSSFQVYVSGLRGRFHNYLGYGQQFADAKTAATCANLRDLGPALWTFVRTQGVEPTNNEAERALRHGVLWRHTSFGTHSAGGSRFVERLLTVRDTLRQQQRNVLDYLQGGLSGCRVSTAGALAAASNPPHHS